jgi:isopenicillin-N N-acyltransferase-like protein
MSFEPTIRKNWPKYLEEMQGEDYRCNYYLVCGQLTDMLISGIAEGAEVQIADIIAINVRTEITFGLFSDGCTALSWRTDSASYLAQNWDWMDAQAQNLIQLTIVQPGKPVIKMITEAGLIGKIGLNSAGVGVCLNAIKAKGMDPGRIPCHLGLRMVLESSSREEAVENLSEHGVASSCHMLVADATGGVGLEWSSKDLRKIEMNTSKQVFHTNHYLATHDEGVVDTVWLKDSLVRVVRVEELCKKLGESPSHNEIQDVFKDEEGLPTAICRNEKDGSATGTLFNIVMNLEKKRATVTLGRPIDPEEQFELSF